MYGPGSTRNKIRYAGSQGEKHKNKDGNNEDEVTKNTEDRPIHRTGEDRQKHKSSRRTQSDNSPFSFLSFSPPQLLDYSSPR